MTLFTELSACPEKLLLVLCARTDRPPQVQAQIREIAARRIDWDYVMDAATENSVVPLLHRQLHAAADSTPAAVRDQLTTANRANTVRCLFLSAELAKIVELLRVQRVVALPYKGPVLAMQAYGDVTLRDFDDLDIVVRQADMMKADEVLRSLGYRPKFEWLLSGKTSRWMAPGEYKYVDAARRAIVELHTEVTLRHFPKAPDLERLASRAATIELGGRGVPTFCAEDGLPILSVHGAKDFWERISWVADVAELVRSQALINWDEALRSAETSGTARMLNLGLLLAADVLDAPLPSEILRLIRRDGEAAQLSTDLARRLLNRDEPPMDARAIFRFRRHMVMGRSAGWVYALRLSLLPAEEDLNAVRLPIAVAPLYFAVRPLRLLRKYHSARTGRPDSGR